MLELNDICIRTREDDRVLAEHFSFTLQRGDKAVIIGEEGNGKSTLLKYIYDPRSVETFCDCSGTVRVRGKLTYLPQQLDAALLDTRISDYFAGAAAVRWSDIPARLGIPSALLDSEQRLGTLSGGEKVKLQLCRMLLDDPDILLLDEPGNDLDIETLEWLESFLRSTRLPVLFISHDETLIERSANVIIHMEQLIRKTKCRITVSREDYQSYLARRRRDFAHQNQVAKKQRDDYERQMQRWRQIHDRVEYEQRTITRADPGGGRLLKKKMHTVLATGKRMERQREDFLDFSEEEEAILTRFDPAVRIPEGKVVLDFTLNRLTVEDRILAEHIRLYAAGSRFVGITGRNGAGKSTLLRLLWEELRQRQDITAAYMPQDYSEVLDYSKTPLDHLAASYSKNTVTLARQYMGCMRFTHREMCAPVGALSGGQRAKLLFLDMVLKRANVLLLDEPTRNFSPLSAPVVRKALRSFGGAILSVSHDRKYLAEVCDVVYELRQDGLHRTD